MGRSKVYKRVEQEKDVVRNLDMLKYAIQRDCDIWTVALNNTLGLGRKRLARVIAEVNALYGDYAHCLGADAEYADTVLARRVAQIMGEDYIKEMD